MKNSLAKLIGILVIPALAISCAGEQGVVGPAGEQGPVGEEGPVGDQGPQGKQGISGPSSITFTPNDMCCTQGDNVSVATILQDGWYNQVLVMPEQTLDWSIAKIPLGLSPSWADSSELRMTVFYSVSSVGGEIFLEPGIATYNSGDTMSTEAYSQWSCLTPEATNTIYSESWDITDQRDSAEFMTIALMRYTVEGGSSRCEDSSAADVYIHAVSLEFIP